jgi:flap endonuclease-1
MKLLREHAPGSIKENDIKNYVCTPASLTLPQFSRKVAIDASMSIYQFLVAVRSQEGSQLTDEVSPPTNLIARRVKRRLI